METILIRKVGWGFGLCNMRCKHCYNASSMKASIPRYTVEELRAVANKVCPHIKDVNFGTGELLCNPNALELARYIAGTYGHIDLAVTSNGYTIVGMAPAEVKHLWNDVDISVDFPDEARHNAFRGHPKAWEWAMRALAILKELRMQHTVVMCLTSKTTDEDLLGMLRLASHSDAWLRINWFRQVGRGTADLRIPAQRAWEVVEFLADKVVFSSLDSVFAGPLEVECEPCPAGHRSARIHQDMSVTAYPFLKGPEWTAGNILNPTTGLQDIYDSPAFRRLRARRVPACESCAFVESCAGGCVTRAALHNGGLDQLDDYCPVHNGLIPIVEHLRGRVIVQKQGNLVHDGYLCTTIMRPHKGV